MARYTMTMVFESGHADDAHGPEVLARLALPDHAVHRSSWCDGTTLTVASHREGYFITTFPVSETAFES